MTPVAERRILRMLAATPGHRFFLADFRFYRREAGAFVGAVAERLRLRPATRTPPIKTRTCLRDEGRFLRNLCFTHGSTRFGARGRTAAAGALKLSFNQRQPRCATHFSLAHHGAAAEPGGSAAIPGHGSANTPVTIARRRDNLPVGYVAPRVVSADHLPDRFSLRRGRVSATRQLVAILPRVFRGFDSRHHSLARSGFRRLRLDQ